MAPQTQASSDRPDGWPETRVVPWRLVILLIAVFVLVLLGGGAAFLVYRLRADDLAAQIDARVAEIGVKPAALDPVSQKALRVRAAIASGDFATADRITTNILAHSRVENWRFHPFDDFIADVFAVRPPELGDRLNDWAEKDAGALPLLFRAEYNYDTGWDARGHGFSTKTAPERIKAFAGDIDKALADVDDAIRLDDGDPYAFYLRLKILQGRGMTADFVTAFHEAIAKYPAYYPLYEIALATLQPRWGGSIPAMYAFVDEYANPAPPFSPLKLLYLRLYSLVLSTASVDCTAVGGDRDKTTQCVVAFMQKAIPPGLEKDTLAALQLYDHTDRYQLRLAVQRIVSDMLGTWYGDTYSGAVLQLAATAMHSDTQLVEQNPGHNDYIVDELVAESWRQKGFVDNEVKKYEEAAADAATAQFPTPEDKNVALALIYERLSGAAEQQHRYVDEIAYEKAAVALGTTWDENRICYAYHQLKRYDDALRACTEAIKATGNPSALYWQGKTYEELGHPDEALADLAKTADQEGYFAPYAAIDMTMIYFNRNDDQAALSVLNKYTYLYDPNRTGKSQVAVAYNNRCYAYMQLGDLKKALDDCTESLKYGSIPDAFRKQQELVKRLATPGQGL